MKIFKDASTKKKFANLYMGLSRSQQMKFGDMIRSRADDKITRLDLVDDFYVDEMDVISIYNSIKEYNDNNNSQVQ